MHNKCNALASSPNHLPTPSVKKLSSMKLVPDAKKLGDQFLLFFSHSFMSDSLQPHGLGTARLLFLWNSPLKNTIQDKRLPTNHQKLGKRQRRDFSLGALRRIQYCQYLDFRLLIFRHIRQLFLLLKPSRLWHLSQQL